MGMFRKFGIGFLTVMLCVATTRIAVAGVAPITGAITTDASSLYTVGGDSAIKQTVRFADLNTADVGTPAFDWKVTAAVDGGESSIAASGSRPANTLAGAAVAVPITGPGMYFVELWAKPAGAATFTRLHSRKVKVYAEPCGLLQSVGVTTAVSGTTLTISKITERNIGDAPVSGTMTIRIQDGGNVDSVTGKWTWPDDEYRTILDGVLVNVNANSVITLPGAAAAVRPGLCNIEIEIPNDGIGGDGGRSYQITVK